MLVSKIEHMKTEATNSAQFPADPD
jgi:hypothetical protein